MRYIGIILLSFSLLFVSCLAQKTDKTNHSDMQWILDELATKWEGTKKYTLEILEAMPEEGYNYKPTDEVMTFKAQMEHIHKWMDNHIQKAGHEGLPQIKSANKAEVIASIQADFDTIISFLNSSKPSLLEEKIDMWYGKSSKLRLLHLMDNHVAHHRGQMIVYLRLKNIKAPRYIGW